MLDFSTAGWNMIAQKRPRATPEREPSHLAQLGLDRRAGGGQETVEVRLFVPESLVYFRGHFPGDPLLPGVAQLDLAVLEPLEEAWPELAGRLREVSRLKFLAPIRPGDELQVTLVRGEDRSRVSFRICRLERCCSSGVLAFDVPER